MSPYCEKVEVERVFQQLSPHSVAGMPRCGVSGGECPGPWRIVTRDGSTSVEQPARKTGLSPSEPWASSTARPSGQPHRGVSLEDLDLSGSMVSCLVADLGPITDDRSTRAKPDVEMPRAEPDLFGDLGVAATVDADEAFQPLPLEDYVPDYPGHTGIDLDLVRVIDAWPTLPRRFQVAILAMLDVAKPG